MANVLDDLANDIYVAAEKVGREQVGLIPSVTMNAVAARAAVGDTVRAAFTAEPTEVTPTPSMTIPEGNDQTVTNKTMTLTKDRAIQIPWTGEDIRHLRNGYGFETVYGQQIQQAMRKICNSIESDLAVHASQNASRALGTAGTTPFASDYDVIAFLREILEDNGIGTYMDVSLVLSNAAAANMRNLAELSKANEAGSTEMLRQGTLLDLSNTMIKQSGQIATTTVGSITANVTANADLPVGTTAITVDTDGTGAVSLSAGDIITFAGSAHQYVVAAAVTIGNSASGTITIHEPGLMEAVADTTAVSAEDTNFAAMPLIYAPSFELAMRAPSLPNGGDMAEDRMMVQDPYSGLVFEISVYKGYRKTMIEVAAVWGFKAWQPEYNALLLG